MHSEQVKGQGSNLKADSISGGDEDASRWNWGMTSSGGMRPMPSDLGKTEVGLDNN